MGYIVKKTGYYIFIAGFIALVIYVIVTQGGRSQRDHEYEKAQEIMADAPQIRSGMLYFNALDSRCQYVYDVIKKSIADGDEFTPQMPLVLTEEELHKTVTAILYDDPKLFYVDCDGFDLSNHGYTEKKNKTGYLVIVPSVMEEKYTKVYIPYTAKNDGKSDFFDKAGERFDAALKKADGIISDVHDKYLICRLIHDYLTGICSKTEEGGIYADTAYGALVEGEATSLGYAKAFKLLYERYSGLCYIVEGGGGFWNAALLDDKYCNVDVYNDDLDGELNGTVMRGVNSHLYLCLDDETFYSEHPIGNSPVVCDDKTSYLIYTGACADTPAEIESVVPRLTGDARFSKNYYFEIYCPLEGAADMIKESAEKTLAEEYPDYAEKCEIYRVSEKIPVYIAKLTAKESAE